ncbi:hypothetical protein TNCV_537931 [Trichonephila clavipes]|nr:hypothetical protein TNCV_537931 [Trichonephila clavipes]
MTWYVIRSLESEKKQRTVADVIRVARRVSLQDRENNSKKQNMLDVGQNKVVHILSHQHMDAKRVWDTFRRVVDARPRHSVTWRAVEADFVKSGTVFCNASVK